MRKKLTAILFCLTFTFLLFGCSDKKEELKAVGKSGTSEVTENIKTKDIADAEDLDIASVEDSDIVETEDLELTEEGSNYKDGTYEYQTDLDVEGYYTKGTITIERGQITEVQWTIYDSNNKDRPFDETYEEVFTGNETYIQQSRDDWSGSRGYSEQLIELQDVEEVDAVSGATWTNIKFKQFVRFALIEAAK